VFVSSNLTYTVPAGVHHLHVIAYGGGSGISLNNNGAVGGNTTVALPSGTITAYGHQQPNVASGGRDTQVIRNTNGATNSGATAARANYVHRGGPEVDYQGPRRSTPVEATSSVTPGGTIAITIGAGGSASANGGSGSVLITYEV
jgi:hypothetical protein